jgi:hypothetical protein
MALLSATGAETTGVACSLIIDGQKHQLAIAPRVTLL